ncbi:retrovirus-related pol polyprotein from transposon TNT 1-94 [Tanacetum coccineum]
MDLGGLMRIASINGKRYTLVIVDDYSHYTWVVFLRLKDEALEEIKTFLKRITVLLQALVIIQLLLRATLKTAPSFTVDLTKHHTSLLTVKKPDISFLHVLRALCYPKNDRENIGKLGAKGDIGFFIGYSANSCAYRVYNRRTKKIMETMNVTFDKLLMMDFEQSELDLLFEAMYDDHVGGQPSAAPRTVPVAQAPQVLQTPTTTTTTADTAPTPKNSFSPATSIPSTSQNVDKLETKQHVQHQPATIAENVPNAMFDENTFVNPFATPSTSAAESSSSQYMDPSNMHTFYQPYPHEFQWTKDHPLEQVIGEPSRPVLTRNQLRSDGHICMYALTVSTMKPKHVKEAMTDPVWIESMQDELLQFTRLDVWVLVPPLDNIKPLTLKWLFKNKHDEENTVIRNKNRLVVRGHVYKLKKALYGLKQAPRAWYDELSMFPLQNHFFKGTIDPMLFIRHFDDDILVVHVYVDDIILVQHTLGNQLFYDLLKSRFEMLIFINQSKYVLEILKKYGMETCDPVGTPMEIKDTLDLDQHGSPVDATKYHSVIGALMYLTSSRPDIGTMNMRLWYMKDSGFELTVFSDADYAGCKDTFKSTSVLWMRTQLTDYGFHFNKIPIYSNLKLAIAISCNPVQHSRTKHIAVSYHFIKEHMEKGTIELYFVKTDYQLADLFTKALPVD